MIFNFLVLIGIGESLNTIEKKLLSWAMSQFNLVIWKFLTMSGFSLVWKNGWHKSRSTRFNALHNLSVISVSHALSIIFIIIENFHCCVLRSIPNGWYSGLPLGFSRLHVIQHPRKAYSCWTRFYSEKKHDKYRWLWKVNLRKVITAVKYDTVHLPTWSVEKAKLSKFSSRGNALDVSHASFYKSAAF